MDSDTSLMRKECKLYFPISLSNFCYWRRVNYSRLVISLLFFSPDMIKAFNTWRPKMRSMAVTPRQLIICVGQQRIENRENLTHLLYINPRLSAPCATLSVNASNVPAKWFAGKFPSVPDSLINTDMDINLLWGVLTGRTPVIMLFRHNFIV